MKLILKNSKLVFAQQITNQEIAVEPIQGKQYYWSPAARETIEWTLTSVATVQSSQVFQIDRTKYSKFKIVSPADTSLWMAFAGAEYSQLLYQSTTFKTNTEYGFDDITIIASSLSRTIDGHMNRLHEGEKCCQIAFSLKNNGSSAPTMTPEQFAQTKLVLIP